jgi:hypothetical protein
VDQVSQEDPGTPALETLESVRPAFERQAALARAETERARAALEAANLAESFWTELVGHLVRNELGSVLLHLNRSGEFLQSLSTGDDQTLDQLHQLRNSATASARETASKFGRLFPTTARNAGLRIDPSSRHPKYTFYNGFVRLELDEKKLVARLQSREGEEVEYGLDLALIIAALKAEISRIFERDLNPEPFLRSLHKAYTAVLRSDKLSDGTEVPIRRVSNRLGKNLSRFSTEEFNVDLARVVQSGHTSVEGRQLHLNHTRNTRQGMLLHGLEQGGYVGFISFKTEEHR